MQRTAKELIGQDIPRFTACCHSPKKRAHGIAIKKRGSSAYFGGLYACGGVWICPVCAPRVSEVRRSELQQAIDNAIAMGYGIMLITSTFPHGVADELDDILEKFLEAQRAVKSGRAAADLRTRIGYIGEIRTLEVTQGANGWHPHTHAIWVTKQPLTPEEIAALKADLYSAWRSACVGKQLPEPSYEHGLDIRSARYDIAQYVAKWGFSGELAYTSRKKGKQGGRTSWQLLADAADGCRTDGDLWKEFALAFFGKRQLFWSRRKTGRRVMRPIYERGPITGKKVKVGEKLVDEWISLRDELHLPPELTDQQALDLEDDREETVVVVDLDTWHVIRKSHAQAHVLNLAATDIRDLYGYLNLLRSTVPMEDGRPPGPREDWEL